MDWVEKTEICGRYRELYPPRPQQRSYREPKSSDKKGQEVDICFDGCSFALPMLETCDRLGGVSIPRPILGPTLTDMSEAWASICILSLSAAAKISCQPITGSRWRIAQAIARTIICRRLQALYFWQWGYNAQRSSYVLLERSTGVTKPGRCANRPRKGR